MKNVILFMIVTTFITGTAFAVETNTECQMMREQNDRTNPKANLGDLKQQKDRKQKTGATKQ